MLGILNEYPQVSVPAGSRAQLGDAYAGERRRVVFELHVPHLAALGPVKVAELVVRYVSVGEQIEQHELRSRSSLTWSRPMRPPRPDRISKCARRCSC